jgi:Secretion system C-terminal sorting domain
MTRKFNYLLWIIILCPLSMYAQVTLEWTYPTTNLHRVNWTFGGENYWFANDSLREIKVFSGAHQLVNVIPYPSVSNAQVRLLQGEYGVSQTVINGDPLLEIVWLVKDTVTKKESLIIKNELGNLLFQLNARPYIVDFSVIEGLSNKLFITTLEIGLDAFTTKVFSLPNVNLENVYFRSYYLHRKVFGIAGEKYFYKDSRNRRMQIYNADHSFWKYVDLTWFNSISIDDTDTFTDADDNVFSKDSLVSVSFSYANSNGYNNIILCENWKRYRPDNTSFIIDKKDGLDTKILQITWTSSGNSTFRLIKLNDFIPQIQFESINPISRFLSKKYGEVIANYGYFSFSLFLSNYRNLKTMNFNPKDGYNADLYSGFYQSDKYYHLCDSLIHRDSLFEAIYLEKKSNVDIFRIKIANDTGKIYQTIDSTRDFSINTTKGLPAKLFTKTGNSNPYNTKVWRLGGATTGIKEAPSVFEVKLYPNPSNAEINVELLGNTEGGQFAIDVYNLLGKNVYSVKNSLSNQFILKKEQLGNGVFIVKISQGQNSISKKVFFN